MAVEIIMAHRVLNISKLLALLMTHWCCCAHCWASHIWQFDIMIGKSVEGIAASPFTLAAMEDTGW
jgi:hypothetical protein